MLQHWSKRSLLLLLLLLRMGWLLHSRMRGRRI